MSADVWSCHDSSSGDFALQTDSPEEMHSWIRDIETKIQEFRCPPKVTALLTLQKESNFRFSLRLTMIFFFFCLSNCRDFHLNVHHHSTEVTMPHLRLVVNRAMSADLH